jgi:hypothetical protein
MPDDNEHHNFNAFDREPATGSGAHADTTEHADLKHRIEADSADDRPDGAGPVHHERVNEGSQPVAPVAAPAPVVAELPHPGPGLMVLQWLVYAFWGWTVFSLSWLIFAVVTRLIDQRSYESGRSLMSNEGISYLLASVIVLFIIAILSDIFYARAERKHASTTGTNVIMIIHAVIFALFGIAALIAAVFGGVSLMVGEATDTTGAVSTIITGGIIFVLYGATLLRTLRPRWIKGVAPFYWMFMTLTVIISVVLGVMGPAAQVRLSAQDALVENNLPSLAESINAHTKETGSLPKSLNELTNLGEYGEGDDLKKLIDSNRVAYTPGERLTNDSRSSIQMTPGSSQMGGTVPTAYHYELCATYKTAVGTDYSTSRRYKNDTGDRYDTYISTFEHPKGEKCYDIQTDFLY